MDLYGGVPLVTSVTTELPTQATFMVWLKLTVATNKSNNRLV
mgnify:CR=1 FL=1